MISIRGLGLEFPSHVWSNEDVIDIVRGHSEDGFEGDLDQTLEQVRFFFAASGAEQRKTLDPDVGETPIKLVRNAVEAALDEAKVTRQEIDILMHVGVGKGFHEPAQAFLTAQACGFDNVECFDVLEACMSWVRGLQLAAALIQSGQAERILIVNSEFHGDKNGPFQKGSFTIRRPDDVWSSFPSMTIGSVATATIVEAGDSDLKFNFVSRPKYADLCTIGTENASLFCQPSPRINKNGALAFTSFGQQLFKIGAQMAARTLEGLALDVDDIKFIFPHTVSKTGWESGMRRFGLHDKAYYLYPQFGNLVSASIPACIGHARDSQSLQKGDPLCGLIVSAGMSAAALSFRY